MFFHFFEQFPFSLLEDSLLLPIIEKIIFAVNTILLAGLYLLKSILIANSEINHVTNHSIGRSSLHMRSHQTIRSCRDKAPHIHNGLPVQMVVWCYFFFSHALDRQHKGGKMQLD